MFQCKNFVFESWSLDISSSSDAAPGPSNLLCKLSKILYLFFKLENFPSWSIGEDFYDMQIVRLSSYKATSIEVDFQSKSWRWNRGSCCGFEGIVENFFIQHFTFDFLSSAFCVDQFSFLLSSNFTAVIAVHSCCCYAFLCTIRQSKYLILSFTRAQRCI